MNFEQRSYGETERYPSITEFLESKVKYSDIAAILDPLVRPLRRIALSR